EQHELQSAESLCSAQAVRLEHQTRPFRPDTAAAKAGFSTGSLDWRTEMAFVNALAQEVMMRGDEEGIFEEERKIMSAQTNQIRNSLKAISRLRFAWMKSCRRAACSWEKVIPERSTWTAFAYRAKR
ncbi:MAG: hypothetical protein ACREDO_04260, partial [Methyloceanibacter sp.]